jgi:hypothetical protein
MIDKRKRKLKFLTLYNSFSAKEKNEFQNYLKINFSTKHRNYNRILSSLKFNERGIIDIDGAESSITRWNRFSELNLLAEKFLLQKSIESDNIYKTGMLLKELDKKNLITSFSRKYKKLKNEISKIPVVNYDYDFVSQLDIINLNHLKKTVRPGKLDKIFMDTYNFRLGTFLIELLELMVDTKTQRRTKLLVSDFVGEEIFNSLNFEKILSYLNDMSNNSNKLYQLIKFLYLMFLCINDINDKESYLTAKKIFFKDLKSISREKRTNYYTFLMNYNIELLNNSVPGAYKELFFLMNKKIKEGLTDDLKVRYLHLNQFRNYIIVGLFMRKFTWVSYLIINYGPILPASGRENDILMGKSLLLFAKKEYTKCKVLLGQIIRLNPYYFIDVSVLKLKTLYELNNLVECHDELKNFKEYLRKDRIVNDHLIKHSREFFKAYSLLLKLNQDPSTNNLSDLQFLLSKKELIAKNWIIQKSEEIGRRIKN